jgi:dienelactone hydrolase
VAELRLELSDAVVTGDLVVPPGARGLVVFAHGSGSSRLSPRNRVVAGVLRDDGFATLLFDLLTPDEGERREAVFDIALLGRRLGHAVDWAGGRQETAGLPVGLFGASTGAAAALRAAAAAPQVRAVVSRGGRPDLAADSLAHVRAPTLLVVGSLDEEVLALNRRAAQALRCEHRLVVVEGASHVFAEPGTLEAAASAAADWFGAHLPRRSGNAVTRRRGG